MNEPVRTSRPGPGTMIGGRYRLEQVIGTGGMAQVWSATDTVLGRTVAVKLLHPHLREQPAFVQRFRREAQAAARLHHPGAVAVYDTVADDLADAIVMELLDGETLRAQLDRARALPEREAARIGAAVATTLAAAHQVGLVHRDVKPANIVLCHDGTVKVADFGIAKADGPLSELTTDGTLLGTAGYVAPEQLEGGAVDGRADQFGLGVVLYESVAGRAPFTGDTDAARALARLHQAPVPLSSVARRVSPPFAAAVHRCLQRDPRDRFASCAELAAVLGDLAQGDTAPGPRGRDGVVTAPARSRAQDRPGRPPSERRWIGAAVLIALIGGSLLLIAALVQPGGRTAADRPVTATPSPVGVASVTAFDPEGDGSGENDTQAPRAVDGDPATGWRTERYRARRFGIKSGVGLVLRLSGRPEVQRVEVDSPTQGWSADLYVLDAPPDGPPAGRAVGSVRNAAGPATVSIGARRGAVLLVWVTDLGSGPDRYRFEAREVRVSGTP